MYVLSQTYFFLKVKIISADQNTFLNNYGDMWAMKKCVNNDLQISQK